PGPGRVRPHVDLRDHGRGELRPRGPRDARRLRGRDHGGRHRELLARPAHRRGDPGGVRRRDSDHDPPAAAGARPAHHHPRHLRHLAGLAEVRHLAVGAVGPPDRRAHLGTVPAFLPPVSLVPDPHRAALGLHHRRALSLPEVREIRNLDPGHHPGSRDGGGHGHSGAPGAHHRVRHRRRHGGGQRRALRPLGRRHAEHGLRLHPARLHRGGGGRDGQSGRLHPGRHLHQPAGSLCVAGGLARPGRHRVLRGADPHAPHPAHRALRAHAQMSAPRRDYAYWIGFVVVVALLWAAPLVLPGSWGRFATEILIWGLLAMSSDILIGYTGMVSFGHSVFFGLGMYGAAAALLSVKPPNLWLALAYGLVAAAVVSAFVAYFATRLREIYFSITTLVFSQIFYVIIFTWTEVTGGENGLTFSQPPLSFLGLYSARFTPTTLHWFVLAVVVISFLLLRRITQSPFGKVLQSIRENEPRTRAIGYSVERYKIVAVMLSGLFAGLSGILYALQNKFAAPDFVFFVISGEVVIFNVMGGMGTLVGPVAGAAFFFLLREGLSRYFTEYYLIPVGIIFTAMVIFMPQGILGFLRRRLNA